MTNLRYLKALTSAGALYVVLLSATDLFAYSNECVTTVSSNNNKLLYHVYCYDNNEREIYQKHYEGDPENGGTLYSERIYTYDKLGNKNDKFYYVKSDGSRVLGGENNYDTNNNQTFHSEYYSDGTFYEAWSKTYNANGLLTSQTAYNGDPNNGGQITEAAIFDIDESGNTIGLSFGRFKDDSKFLKGYGSQNSLSREITESEWKDWLLANMPERIITDSSGSIIARYDGANNLRYAKDMDGAAYHYDVNGNLTGMTKRGPFTIPEANALTKDGPVNTVTITW